MWRERERLTIEQLAEKLSISSASVSRIESGLQQPRPELLARIARLFGTTEAAFYWVSQELAPASIGLRRIPVLDYGLVSSRKDQSSPASGETRGFVLTDVDYSQSVFAMKITGEAMRPRFDEGDLVLIDPDVKPRPNDSALFRLRSAEIQVRTYKERGIDSTGKVIFEALPENDGYPSWRSDVLEIEIVGTVVEHRKYRKK